MKHFKEYRLAILFLIILFVQSLHRKKIDYKSIRKGFFNMRGLALISAIITKYEGNSNIVENYKRLASECVTLSNLRIYHNLNLLTQEFYRIYFSYRKINALRIITKNDKLLRNYHKEDYKEFALLNIKKLKGKSVPKKDKMKLKNLFKIDKLDKFSINEKRRKMKALLKNIILRTFKLIFSSLRDCKIVPKKLRRYSKKLVKTKAKALKKMIDVPNILQKMVNGLNTMSYSFDWMKIRTKPFQIVKELKLIAGFFMKFITK